MRSMSDSFDGDAKKKNSLLGNRLGDSWLTMLPDKLAERILFGNASYS